MDDRIAFQRLIIRRMNLTLNENAHIDLHRAFMKDPNDGSDLSITDFFMRYSVAIAVMDEYCD